METFCFHCNKMVTYTKTNESQILNINGKVVRYNPIVCRCDCCGDEVYVDKYFNDNIQQAREIFKKEE